METWGYVRVSTTKEQQGASYEDQADRLTAAGCHTIIREEASAGSHRPIFTKMIEDAGDRAEETGQTVNIHVTKMDRAFRDLSEAIRTVKRARKQNVVFTLHDIAPTPLDPSDPAQALHFHILAAISTFEKARFAERRAVGIAKAKREGKYKGRAPTARAKTAEILAAKAQGLKPGQIAKIHDVSVASVYRILADAKAETSNGTEAPVEA